MIGGQRQSWFDSQTFDPPTYWIRSYTNSVSGANPDIVSTTTAGNNLAVASYAYDGTFYNSWIDIQNLNGVRVNQAYFAQVLLSQIVSDGTNIYAVGTQAVTGGTNWGIWIASIDASTLNINWQKVFTDSLLSGNGNETYGYTISLAGSNLVVGGMTRASGVILNIAASTGAVNWSTGPSWSGVLGYPQYLATDSSSNIYYVAGHSQVDPNTGPPYNYSAGNITIAKLDSSGTVQWNKQFAQNPTYPTNSVGYPDTIAVDSDGNPWVSLVSTYNRATFLQLSSSTGAVTFQNTLIDPNHSGVVYIENMVATTGNVYAVGHKNDTTTSAFVLKLSNASGTIQNQSNIAWANPNTRSSVGASLALAANADMYISGLNSQFILSNNFSTTGTFNNSQNTINIVTPVWEQGAGNLIYSGGNYNTLAFASSNYATSNVAVTNNVYTLGVSLTPIKTNPAPPAGLDIEYLAIAGGGGGASGVGGGGGAGGLRTGTFTATASTVYTATVGGGGAGGPFAGFAQVGSNGTNSSIAGSGLTTITATGGGGGGASDITPVGGAAGGSGGGGCYDTTNNANLGGAGTAGQGNDGGDGAPLTSPYATGGGGGAGAAGGDYSGSNSGSGGVGVQSSITGTATYYGGGGGGGGSVQGAVAGSGGSGGGSAGSDGSAGAATANTGGGGGGGGNNGAFLGGDGGSGVVIFRILTSQYTGTVTGSPTVTTDGSYTVIKFTGTGTYTA